MYLKHPPAELLRAERNQEQRRTKRIGIIRLTAPRSVSLAFVLLCSTPHFAPIPVWPLVRKSPRPDYPLKSEAFARGEAYVDGTSGVPAAPPNERLREVCSWTR